jgi:hypothetical protein
MKVGRPQHIDELSELSRVLLVSFGGLKNLLVELRVILDRLLNSCNALCNAGKVSVELVKMGIKSCQGEGDG